ncbi:venom allergen 3 homolog [Aricia agestis]|uniref:venom allergen 3 homolog n=1 Tax=Aricia agestis TaxID=91739 RepID=UPI001C2079EA|nr:venom allergen 3 homolog [Aricia agestis]
MILKKIILSLLIFRFCYCVQYNTTDVFNYCLHPDCSLPNQHTLCVTKNRQSSRLFAAGLTSWMRYQLLLLHNKHRDNIAMGLEAGQPKATNMRKMYWDHELEDMAEAWASQCQKRHDECRNTIRFNVLQNMDVRPVESGVTEAQLLADAVGSWFSGSRSLPSEHVRLFRLSKCGSPRGCNNHWYSAATWASTWRIGCSQSLCTMNEDSCIRFPKSLRRSSPSNTTRKKSKSLRGTKCYTTAKSTMLDEFSAVVMGRSGKSLLYRGAIDVAETRKPEETKIVAYTFCNYGPAGNVEGFPIYEIGTTCSNCPQGTKCTDKTHRGLCTVAGDPDSKV